MFVEQVFFSLKPLVLKVGDSNISFANVFFSIVIVIKRPQSIYSIITDTNQTR